MKHKFPSVPDRTSDQNTRRNAGQAIAALVMALALTVGGASTTILLATQPAGLTVAPAAVEWEAPAISLQPEKSASTEAASESTAGSVCFQRRCGGDRTGTDLCFLCRCACDPDGG